MGKPYFQFKKFRVWQDRCAMKVCTDSCILGAYTDTKDAQRILDIGTGTGLIALMLAQRSPYAHIDAVEIDFSAYSQALQNVADSEWASQIRVYHQAIQKFQPDYQYDMLVSNPPFFQNHHKSENQQINLALHNDGLNFQDLIQAVKRLMKKTGKFMVLLPPLEMRMLENYAKKEHLFLYKRLKILEYKKKKYCLIREIASFHFNPTPEAAIEEETLCIQTEAGKYSDEFVALLKDYYCIF